VGSIVLNSSSNRIDRRKITSFTTLPNIIYSALVVKRTRIFYRFNIYKIGELYKNKI